MKDFSHIYGGRRRVEYSQYTSPPFYHTVDISTYSEQQLADLRYGPLNTAVNRPVMQVLKTFFWDRFTTVEKLYDFAFDQMLEVNDVGEGSDLPIHDLEDIYNESEFKDPEIQEHLNIDDSFPQDSNQRSQEPVNDGDSLAYIFNEDIISDKGIVLK